MTAAITAAGLAGGARDGCRRHRRLHEIGRDGAGDLPLPAAHADRRGDDLEAGAASARARAGASRPSSSAARCRPTTSSGRRSRRASRRVRPRRATSSSCSPARRTRRWSCRTRSRSSASPEKVREESPPRRELSRGAESTPRLTPRIVRARPSGRQPGGSSERPSVRECPGAAHGGDPQRSFGARVLGTRRSADRRVGRDPKLRIGCRSVRREPT